jgi:hypothetical protein
MEAPISSRVSHRTANEVVVHEQQYLMSELESLGLSTIRLNEFNNNEELRHLVHGIKETFLSHYMKNAM